ncbi:hypothetical protein QWJ26_38890 [Streptomyces sp. CSDS2]|uniref:hypothetical protein n=1 Tax=Streptomyces sp. CSDS2 TaxID=3055051 RepID=UPI0025AF1A83|nr:hypothetical protein [Streptomyces sp. CSDS2]MDN3265668.1 hypothetical protein [Streptomyces sp. CSDS2]
MAPIGLAFAVLRIGGDPGALGVVLAASIVAQILLLLVAADRLPMDRVMVWSNAVCPRGGGGAAGLRHGPGLASGDDVGRLREGWDDFRFRASCG